MTRKRLLLILGTIITVGLLLRLFHINFGLPITYFPDETDLSDAAVKYAVGYRSAIQAGDINFFKPASFVFGTFPTYFLSVNLLLFIKITSVFKLGFDYFGYLVEMRVVTAVISTVIPVLIGLVYFKLFKDKKGLIVTVFLAALNWKLIYHSHYLNQDTFLTLMLCVTILFLLFYLKSNNAKKESLFTLLAGLAFGLAVGTKITALLSLPIVFLLFISIKNWKGIVLFSLSAFLAYVISNPFSVIALQGFISRVLDMGSKEGGIVFSSVDTGPFKYIYGLGYMLTIPVLLVSLFGAFKVLSPLKSLKLNDKEKLFHIFLILNILAYVIFYSLEPKRSDRYMLPILPLIILYAGYGVSYLYSHLKINRWILISVLFIAGVYYIYFPLSLSLQLMRNKPRVDAYYWFKQQRLVDKTTLVYTEDGRDPFAGIKGVLFLAHTVYVSEGAQFSYPIDPLLFDYVVLASKPLDNYKRPYVIKNYPKYFNKWNDFENLVTNSNKFSLIKKFQTTNLNLLYFSDVSIYKRN